MNLSKVNVKAVLDYLGIKTEKRGNELYARCPHPKHNDSDPSWSIKDEPGNKRHAVFSCWSCKWSGNILTLIAAVKKISIAEAQKIVEEFSTKRPQGRPTTEKDLLRGLDKYEPPDLGGYFWKGEQIQTEPIIPGTESFAYLSSRWIGMEWIEKCNLVDWPDKKRILVPVHLNGKLISWVARSYNGGSPKTLAPKEAPKSWELIGIDEVVKIAGVANLTEGWADRIRLMQIKKANPLGLNGARISEQQAEMILWADKIVVWMDGDRAGEVLAGEAVTWLGKTREIWVVPFPPRTDPAFYSPKVVATYKPILWSEFRKRR